MCLLFPVSMEQYPLPSERNEFLSNNVEKPRSHGFLQKLARSTRGRIGLALMGLAGAFSKAESTQAANMVPGDFIRAGVPVDETPTYSASFKDLNGFNLEITNVGVPGETQVRWVGVQSTSPTQQLDAVKESGLQGSDVPVTYVTPDDQLGGVVSQEFLAIANLDELQAIRAFTFPVNMAVDEYLQNSIVYVSYAPLTGNPTTVDEAIAMTDGDIVTAQFPDNLDIQEDLVLYTGDLNASDPGDFDGDGDVDGSDFLAWQRGESPTPLSTDDLSAWQNNYGFNNNGSFSALQSVPEPNSVVLGITAAGLAVLGTRRRVQQALNQRDS